MNLSLAKVLANSGADGCLLIRNKINAKLSISAGSHVMSWDTLSQKHRQTQSSRQQFPSANGLRWEPKAKQSVTKNEEASIVLPRDKQTQLRRDDTTPYTAAVQSEVSATPSRASVSRACAHWEPNTSPSIRATSKSHLLNSTSPQHHQPR